MPRFFLPSSCFDDFKNKGGQSENEMGKAFAPGQETCVLITGADARHISRSLRMKVKDKITLCDMRLTEYDCVIEDIGSDSVKVRVLSANASLSEMPCRVTLYQALAKGDKMDRVIQKAVELGACGIVPVQSERAVVKLDEENAGKKTQRWQKIAKEASGQCGRGRLCEVSRPVDFETAVNMMKKDELFFVCYEGDADKTLKELLPSRCPKSIGFLIGPEGGFSFREVGYMSESGVPMCKLGKRILRTETASGYVLSCLSFLYEL